jgi:long-subunit acyl-CoA synthetase (AMP-forming)
VVIGDRKPFLAALVSIDEDKFDELLRQSGSTAETLEEVATCPQVNAFLMREVEQLNAKLARVQTIKKIKVLPHDFSVESGELTPSMKIKRKVVYSKYAAEIEAFYQ